MIERYTIKFGAAVSQKELGKIINDEASPHEALQRAKLLKARIEVVADFADIHKLSAFLKDQARRPE